MLISMLLTGCAGRIAPAPEADPVERFRVQVQADFTTTGLEELPAEQAALLSAVGFDIDLVILREPSRTFEDGSLGHYLRFESAQGTLRRGEHAESVPLTLAGRTVEARTFDDGELLDLTLLEHAAGVGRYADVFDLIFPVLHPSPPDLKPRERRPRAMHWPVRLSDTEQLLNTLWAQWSIVESTPAEWHLGYSGKWSIRGSQEAGDRRVPAGGEGTGAGEVWISRDDGQLQRHTFQWSRELTLIYAPHDDEVIRLKQAQSFVGALERL